MKLRLLKAVVFTVLLAAGFATAAAFAGGDHQDKCKKQCPPAQTVTVTAVETMTVTEPGQAETVQVVETVERVVTVATPPETVTVTETLPPQTVTETVASPPRIVTKVKKVRAKPRVVVKWRTKWRTRVKTKWKPCPRLCPPGTIAHRGVCAVPGSG